MSVNQNNPTRIIKWEIFNSVHLTLCICLLNAVDAACCEACSAHSLGSSLCQHKEPLFTLVIPLLIQDQPYTPNYLRIHPLHTVFLPFCFTAPACRNAGRASSLWRRQQFGCSSSNISLVAALLGGIQSTLECPCRENTKAELCGWVWEEKCNNFHLNASTLPNTMGMSFTGIRPPLYSEKEACRDLALMRQQAFPWLVTNRCVWSLSLD